MRSLGVVLIGLTLIVAAQGAVTWYTCLADKLQDVPAAAGTVTATGTIGCQLDDVALTLACNATWTGLSGAILSTGGLHIHGPALQGENAGAKWTFTNYASTATGSWWQIFTGLTTQDVTDFNDQKFYANYHTVANPTGEIRCQMYKNTLRYQADLTVGGIIAGGGTVGAPTPTGYGRGWLTFDPTTGMANVRVYVWGLTGAFTAMHIHSPALATAQAGVLFAIAAEGTPTAEFGIAAQTVGPYSLDQWLDLTKNMQYIAVHTSANPGGEIRGQLQMGLSLNNIQAGNYAITCKATGANSEAVCITVDSLGRVTWNQASYDGSTVCAPAMTRWAKQVNFTMATLGMNQFRSRLPVLEQLDMGVIRPWTTTFASKEQSDVNSMTAGCGACAGVNTNRFGRTVVMRPACPNTCELLKETYGNFYFSTSPLFLLQFTQFKTDQTAGWADINRSYYSFTAASGCRDYIAEVPTSAGSMVQPSVLFVAAAALLALTRF